MRRNLFHKNRHGFEKNNTAEAEENGRSFAASENSGMIPGSFDELEKQLLHHSLSNRYSAFPVFYLAGEACQSKRSGFGQIGRIAKRTAA